MKLSALLIASVFALSCGAAFAQNTPAPATGQSTSDTAQKPAKAKKKSKKSKKEKKSEAGASKN